MKLGIPTIGFSIMNNVEIQVIDKKSGQIKKKVKTHNKATRKMVTGILHFIEGYLTATNERSTPLYDGDFAKQYIPCYFNVGDGGVIIGADNTPMPTAGHPEIPQILDGWSESVDYLSTGLVREFNITRTKIRKQDDTFLGNDEKVIDTLDEDYTKEEYRSESGSALSMDSLYFQCEIQPGAVNDAYGGKNVYVTELGLFSNQINNTPNLLAYVKLNNYEGEDEQLKTNALYVKPQDTIVVKWVITIAAIGKDNVLVANIKDGSDKLIVNDITEIPEGHYVSITEYPGDTNGGNG